MIVKNAATTAPATSCLSSGKTLPLISSLVAVARALWPSKADMELASRAQVSERMARYLLAKKCGMSAEALANLLRTEDGLQFLRAAMSDSKPVWFRDFERHVELARLTKNLAQIAKDRDRLVNAFVTIE